MSDEKSPCPTGLTSLPTELLLAILDDDLQAYDLIALSRTNHRLHDIVSAPTSSLAQRLQAAHCAHLSISAATLSLTNIHVPDALNHFATFP